MVWKEGLSYVDAVASSDIMQCHERWLVCLWHNALRLCSMCEMGVTGRTDVNSTTLSI
jgi:hypothetical protein